MNCLVISMRAAFFLGVMILALACVGSFEAAGQAVDRKLVHAFLAKDKDSKPATTFPDDVSSIYLIWKGEDLQAGDRINVIWIAEDVGGASPKESKIGEHSVIVYKSDEVGSFFVSRPRSRVWPAGRYRTEIYIGKKLVNALRFTIQSGVSVELH
jgi:hypothetical protein